LKAFIVFKINPFFPKFGFENYWKFFEIIMTTETLYSRQYLITF